MLLHIIAALMPMTTPRVVVLGGSGRIGTAVASHMLATASQPIDVVLAGRSEERGRAAVEEVRGELAGSSVTFMQLDWRDAARLGEALRGASAVVHTAGPYAGEDPEVLRAACAQRVPVYVDLSDPAEYLEAAKGLSDQATDTLALCAAGAFPGLSNVLAMECAARLGKDAKVKDVSFNYFTAGLGGSGDINLFITNDGFGCEVPVYRNGVYSPTLDAGASVATRPVKFFLDPSEPSARLVGERKVWPWPFPEGRLVPEQLEGGISGDSFVGMGTAPDIWNTVMGIMVDAVPRSWWRNYAFSNGLAKFSKPLVAVTDRFVGETHAMRVDITSDDGRRVTAVQAHESFRRVVGQCCAEFTLALLESRGLLDPAAEDGAAHMAGKLPGEGVFTPEGLFKDSSARTPMLERLLSVPGTLNYGFEEGAIL